MSTLVKEHTTQTVDFTGKEKTLDWRYRTWEGIQDTKTQKSIYWIGVLPLDELEEVSHKCFLYFLNRGNLEMDCTRHRDVDGAATGHLAVIEYDLDQPVIDALVDARSEGYKFFNLFLEETVDSYGRHNVYILYNEHFATARRYGIATEEPWFTEDPDKWKPRIKVPIPDTISRICILNEISYNWLK